jgi:hypothetical protein
MNEARPAVRHRYELVLVWLAVVIVLAVAVWLGWQAVIFGDHPRTCPDPDDFGTREPGWWFIGLVLLGLAWVALLRARARKGHGRFAHGALTLALVVVAGVVFVYENVISTTSYTCA